jgi:hypothetical protein
MNDGIFVNMVSFWRVYQMKTHSRISNRVHTELKPYRPGFTRIDPHRNPCQFLRIPWLRYGEKTFWVVFTNVCKDFNFVLISVLNRFEPHRPASTRSVKLYRPLSHTACHSKSQSGFDPSENEPNGWWFMLQSHTAGFRTGSIRN